MGNRFFVFLIIYLVNLCFCVLFEWEVVLLYFFLKYPSHVLSFTICFPKIFKHCYPLSLPISKTISYIKHIRAPATYRPNLNAIPSINNISSFLVHYGRPSREYVDVCQEISLLCTANNSKIKQKRKSVILQKRRNESKKMFKETRHTFSA